MRASSWFGLVVLLLSCSSATSLAAPGRCPSADDVATVADCITSLASQLPAASGPTERRELLLEALKAAKIPLPPRVSPALFPQNPATFARFILLSLTRAEQALLLARLAHPSRFRSERNLSILSSGMAAQTIAARPASSGTNASQAPRPVPEVPNPAPAAAAGVPVASAGVPVASAGGVKPAQVIKIKAPEAPLDRAGFREPPVQYAPEGGGPQGSLDAGPFAGQGLGEVLVPIINTSVTAAVQFDAYPALDPGTGAKASSTAFGPGLLLPALNAVLGR